MRFGAETRYAVLDIDRGSLYHPQQDPLAISRIVAALEPLGLVSYVACTSSYSGGLHLYFPFTQTQSSWKLAIALAALLENCGFKLTPGQLEVFPNPKPYLVDRLPTLFNAHRLPLQAGSYLLNNRFSPVWSTHQTFVQQWSFAQNRNEINALILQRIIKQFRRRPYLVSGKADKFINDLNAEIELGWTAFSQTNRLLGRITMREYIFYHVLHGGEPLLGEALINRIVEVARSLPGYDEFCRHRHEIHVRAEEWARCIENSHYFHYGDASGKFKAQHIAATELQQAAEQVPSWNQQQTLAARERIQRAIAELTAEESLPPTATARFQRLVGVGIGGSTLYRHRDLWHPKFLPANQPDNCLDHDSDNRLDHDSPDHDPLENPQPVENPPLPPTSLMTGSVDCFKASTELRPTSLFSPAGRNLAGDKASGGFVTVDGAAVGRNLADSRDRNPAAKRSDLMWVVKMQQFFNSGDPILVAEALLWAKNYPGVLDSS